MPQPTRYAGLDVHRDTIVVALLPQVGQVELVQEFPHDLPKLKRFFQRALKEGGIRACYEAGGCGYGLQREMEKWGVPCQVIAPSLIPRGSGERVKTDKRDAVKLALALRAEQLTAVRVPSEEEERIRALVRARDGKQRDVHATQQQILKLLQLRGLTFRDGNNWGTKFWKWFKGLKWEAMDQMVVDSHMAQRTLLVQLRDDLECEVKRVSMDEKFWGRAAVARLRCLHAVETLTAMTIVTEIVDASRFGSPRQLMSFVGLGVSEYSSGSSVRRGGITKAGSSRLRRVLIESAWLYRHPPRKAPNPRWEGQSAETIAFAQKAHVRLHARYWKLAVKKNAKVAVTAVARELTGFVWALMREEVELRREQPPEARSSRKSIAQEAPGGR